MVTRRRFLGISAAAAAIWLVPVRAVAAGARECFLLGDGRRGKESLLGKAPYDSTPGAIKIIYPGTASIHEIPLPFFPHAFAPNPASPNRVVTFEKWGRHMAEVDLEAMSVIRVTEAPAGRRYFGHGAHSGKFIYATQMDDEGGRGLVSKMESSSHKLVDEFETHGAFPHDCQWLPGGNTLLVVNSRKSSKADAPERNYSSLAWLDAQSGKCLKQHFIETGRFGYAHLAQSSDGYCVLAGSYDSRRNGSQPLLAVSGPAGKVRELDVMGAATERLQGEVLSLYLDEASGLVAATLPNASCIQVWNYRTGEFVRQTRVGEPRGLAFSREEGGLLVSSAQSQSLLVLDKTLAVAKPATSGAGTGSHLYRMEL